MNKHLVQDIIKAGNKAMDTVPVEIANIIVIMDFIMMIIM